ncbi:transposase [Streptomyces sp. NPDC059118]|uniref:transposase n=1 Tax=unclassified Streptomyces TaxID=2593676 RepID=UPI0036BCDA9B
MAKLLLDRIRRAGQSGLIPVAKLAAFLRQDLAAVTAGPALEWSSRIVEGHVNRLKTVKRAVYGRASFRLLRIRVLARSSVQRSAQSRPTSTGRE